MARKTPAPAISATGWIADNWPAFACEERPPVIINPAASDGDLLAWCFGEVASLNATALALSDGNDDFATIFWHRLEPLKRVLGAVVERMAAREGGRSMSALVTIRVDDVKLALMAAKMRRLNAGRTCQLGALSEAPMIEWAFECDQTRRHLRSPAERHTEAMRYGMTRARVMPMQRGHISRLHERVQREHGRREVLLTWDAGVRALLAEPKHVLNGGVAA